jgi:hypothetical protein
LVGTKAAGINNGIQIPITETGRLHQPKFTSVILSAAKPVETLSHIFNYKINKT